MGKEVRKHAEKLGLTNLRLTTLYSRPRSIRQKPGFLTRYIPDLAESIRDFISWNYPPLTESKFGVKNVTYYYLAPQAELFIEIYDKPAFWTIDNPAKHALQINIFCNDEEIIHEIANVVDSIWEDGILAHMDWNRIEKSFDVKRDDCIATWKGLLSRDFSPNKNGLSKRVVEKIQMNKKRDAIVFSLGIVFSGFSGFIYLLVINKIILPAIYSAIFLASLGGVFLILSLVFGRGVLRTGPTLLELIFIYFMAISFSFGFPQLFIIPEEYAHIMLDPDLLPAALFPLIPFIWFLAVFCTYLYKKRQSNLVY